MSPRAPGEVEGTVAAGFEPVRQAFADNLARRGEWGASFCAWHAGRLVVDLWGGRAAPGRPWRADTLATMFSATKGLVALCFLMQADRGALDYDRPVADYWPEFARGDKGAIPVRTLLNHAAGLISVSAPLSLDLLEHRQDQLAGILADERPRWAPGAGQGYHAVTFGLYAQELFRRISGETLGRFLAREVARPLGADVYLGLPAELEPRVAHNHPVTRAERALKIVPKLLFDPGRDGRVYRQVALGRDAARAFGNPRELGPRGIDNFNSRRVRALELPWVNAVASARGLCRVYSALANRGEVDRVRLVGADAIRPVMERQSWAERDRVLRKPVGWSQGFLKEESGMFSPNRESFGHPGAGGALGWCDPRARLALGYVTGKMDHRVRSRRARALCAALYACLPTANGS